MLKRILTVVGVLGLVSALGIPLEAQGPDFSGTWTLDAEASEMPPGPGGAGRGRGGAGGGPGRGGGGAARAGGGAATVMVTQTDTELVMELGGAGGQGRTVTYRLDGAESTNAGVRGGSSTTTSTWEGAVLVTEGSQTLSMPRGEFTLTTRERRTLSGDGHTMTVATTRTTPRGDVETTLVSAAPTGEGVGSETEAVTLWALSAGVRGGGRAAAGSSTP